MSKIATVVMLLLLTGCTTDVRMHLGRTPTPACPVYIPAEKELAPLGVDPDLLPYSDPELVAMLLGGELRALRDWIVRQDKRERKAYADYRASCTDPGKSVQAEPSK